MRIDEIALFRKRIEMRCGSTCLLEPSEGHAEVVITRIRTDCGLVGYGECGCVGGYPAAADTILAGSAALAENGLIGLDPRNINLIHEWMDKVPGRPGMLKTGIDMACWDIAGKARNEPLHALLGGALRDDAPIYALIPNAGAAQMVAALRERQAGGHRRFHMRAPRPESAAPRVHVERILALREALGPGHTLAVDFAGTWRIQEVWQLLHPLRDVDFILEQPCWTLAECAEVGRRLTRPLRLDDCLNNVNDVHAASALGVADSVVLHINRLGGILPLCRARAVSLAANMSLTYSSQWGTELTSAALTHVALTTPPAALYSSIDAHGYGSEGIAANTSLKVDGDRIGLRTDAPGLGVIVDEGCLGAPERVLA